VTLLNAPEALASALDGLVGTVAVDTEFHPEFRRVPRLLLIQLRGEGGEVHLIDPLAFDDLGAIGAALRGRTLLFHAAAQDVRLLRRRCGLEQVRVLDVQVMAGLAGLDYPLSLDALSRELLGRAPVPGAGLSDWSRRPLSQAQMAYAAGDVRDLHALADRLSDRLGELRSLAGPASEERLARALAPDVPSDRLRGFAAARVLDALGREILLRLFGWRERVSRESNKPLHQVLGDGVILDVARRAPSTVEELASNRRFPKGVLKNHGATLLQVVAEARAVPEAQRPPPVPRADPRLRGREALLRAWAEAVAHRDGVSPRLMLPPDVLDALLQGEPPPTSLGWRADRWGQELRAVLAGRIALVGSPDGVSILPEKQLANGET